MGSVHFSSKRGDWATPLDLFDRYNEKYDFSIDVCASEDNAKVERYWTERDDGLAQDWSHEVCWMNPPYGREIGQWVEKAYLSARHQGSVVVGLLPARTDTRWFHNFIWPRKAKVELLKGRIKFLEDGEQKHPAPFPSMIVVWGKV